MAKNLSNIKTLKELMALDLLDKPHKARLHIEKPLCNKASLLDALFCTHPPKNQLVHSQMTADD